ncbi:hypothetical protein Dimus_030226, partial [Dionaea muscipula]
RSAGWTRGRSRGMGIWSRRVKRVGEWRTREEMSWRERTLRISEARRPDIRERGMGDRDIRDVRQDIRWCRQTIPEVGISSEDPSEGSEAKMEASEVVCLGRMSERGHRISARSESGWPDIRDVWPDIRRSANERARAGIRARIRSEGSRRASERGSGN